MEENLRKKTRIDQGHPSHPDRTTKIQDSSPANRPAQQFTLSLFMQAKSFSKAIKSCASKAKLQCRNIKLTGRRSPVSFFIRYVLGLNRKNSFLPVRRQNPVPLFLVAEAIFPLKDSSMPGQESDLFYAPDCR